jgi:hypothetical protein
VLAAGAVYMVVSTPAAGMEVFLKYLFAIYATVTVGAAPVKVSPAVPGKA